MRTLSAALVGVLAVSPIFAGIAQDQFQKETLNAVRLVAEKLTSGGEKTAVLFDTRDTERIASVRNSIILIDPNPELTKDGKVLWTLPSFCCAEYSIIFFQSDGKGREFLIKSGVTQILPPDPLGLQDLTDIALSKASQNSLRKALNIPDKVPNQSTDPTLSSGTPPAGQESRHP